MAKAAKLRPWTKEDFRILKTLARERVKTAFIASKLKRTEGATRQQAFKHGVSLGRGRKKRRA
jgi:hypothetical protein